MMTPAEKAAYESAMRVVFAMQKYHIAVESALPDWEAGCQASPVAVKQIGDYQRIIKEGVPVAIDLHDALSQHAS